MTTADSQPTRWTREVAAAPRVHQACSANSIRLTTGAGIGAGAGAFVALMVAITVHGFALVIALILLVAALCFWYITSRDTERRQNALAREEDLVRSLTDIEDRLGGDTEVRRRALADLAEWIALRSRLNGGFFDADVWRRFTHQHGTPMAVLLGVDAPPPDQLAPSYEEIDLEQEKAGLSRRRLQRLALIVIWFGFIAWSNPTTAFRWAVLAFLLGMVAWELGFTPIGLRSAVVSPGRIEIGELRRRRTAWAGSRLAVIEHRQPAAAWGPPITLLRLLGPGPKVAFAFRDETDARIPQFLAAWLTPRPDRLGQESPQDPNHELPSHRPPDGAVSAGAAGAAGHAPR